jgi:hypothetical protein
MKAKVLTVVMVMATSFPALAINAHYRNQLIKSGCTEVSLSQYGCDLNKTPEQNKIAILKGKGFSHSESAKIKQQQTEINVNATETFLGKSSALVMDALQADGWKSEAGNEGYKRWHKGEKKIMLDISEGNVIGVTPGKN